MASQISQQYAYRAQKSLGLVNGTPDYTPIPGFVSPDVPARTYAYSPDGRLYAYALPTVVRIFQAEGAQLLQELSLPNIVEIGFSPRGTYLSTWERPQKLDDATQHKNLRIFSVSTGDPLIAFTQKSQNDWDLQYTISESHAIRLVGPEIQVYRPAEWDKGIVDKLRVEGASTVTLSPGLNPSVAVFVAEKKGAPASIKIHPLLSLSSPPTCQKTFFKADRATIKWNTLGTQVLVLTQTEVDNSNKSYYGETGLYLLSAAGNFDCRVTLDKEGPVHDFCWSPGSKEFGVVYGYMPAKTTLFDQRVRPLHDFGSSPHNFISFSPSARLLLLAGFGNLAGQITLFDRRSLTKVTTISAPNTSYCSWSPDGRFLLTATLSPRLRVDNGIKVWHCSGTLVHVQETEELYQASWRPCPIEACAPFPNQGLPPAPAPSESVARLAKASTGDKVGPAAKPAGAYRPPGARGLATPAIFKREDEGGAARTPTNGVGGAGTPPRGYSRSPAPPPGSAAYAAQQQQGGYGNGNGNGQNGYAGQNGQGQNGRRNVPGAPGQQGQGQQGQGQDGERKVRRKKGKRDGEEGAPDGQQQGQGPGQGQGQGQGGKGRRQNPNQNQNQNPNNANGGSPTPPPMATPAPVVEPQTQHEEVPPTPTTAGLDGSLDPVAKKVRNLNKKLKAIDELKEKAKRGERLEATQLKKMEGEAEIRRELVGLEGN